MANPPGDFDPALLDDDAEDSPPSRAVSTKDTVPMEGTESVVVPVEAAGMRLDTWIARRPGMPSRCRIQQLVKDGRVRLNGSLADKSATLEGGESVDIEWPPVEDPWPRPEPIPLDIVFEDEHIVIVNKQAGLIVHPSAGNPDGTMVNGLLHRFPNLPGINGVKRPGIVHRLDRDTTGLLVVAKTGEALSSLGAQIASRTMHRTYMALVIGDPGWETIRVEAAVGRDPANRLKRAIDGPLARHAVSHFFVRRRAHHHTLIECRLETGRTHQIRIHCEHIGLPIMGDALYEGAAKRSLERLGTRSTEYRAVFAGFGRPFLHAWKLSFYHPARKQRVEFEVPLPPDCQRVMELLWPGESDLIGTRRMEGVGA